MNNTALLAKVNEMVEAKLDMADLNALVATIYGGAELEDAEAVAYFWNGHRAMLDAEDR